MISEPIFGVTITLLFFIIAIWLRDKTKISLLNPMLVTTLLIISFLYTLNIPYESYKIGGDMILNFLGPITVILALPLYRNRTKLKKYYVSIFVGILSGSFSVMLTVISLSYLLGIQENLMPALLAKSVTTPIGLSISDMVGANRAITMIAIVFTGILGVTVAPILFKIFKITNPIARGIALGTTSHAIGTGKAFEYGSLEGAMSSVSIALAGISSIFWVMFFQSIGIL
jgi:predicted murein hydrolase (TIGR00659 family)